MKQSLIKTLHRIIIWLSRFLRKLNKENTSSTFSLVPQILKDPKDIDKIQPYMDLLDKGLEDPTITNIAVSGQYGSGKSTVIRTYQHNYPKFKYLNISLAAFNNEGEGKDENDLREKIEISILQQIFYHEKPQNLPKSRFNRIINPSFSTKFFRPIFIILWLIGVYVFYNNLNKLDPYTWGSDLSSDWIFISATVTVGIGLLLLIKNLFTTWQGIRFSKLNYKGLEIGDDVPRSIFNRHFDEILYFFQSTEYEVVVIEDLDRFYSSEIFAKLREINITLNQSKQLNYPVNFVYALKDEILKDKKERVKFFDLIIPIIPFINSSNAGEQFIKILKELNLKKKLTEGLIDDVITFIDDIDMRLLKNIIIEYQTYSSILPNDLNQDNLFSMIVYKNLKPDDFGKLSRKEGDLYTLISKKADYIGQYINDIDQKIDTFEMEIKNANSERISSIEELKRIFLIQLFKEHKWTYRVRINNNHYRFDELLEDENFDQLWGPYKITLEGINDNRHFADKVLDKSFEEIERNISPDYSYSERKTHIENKSKEKRQKTTREIELLEDRKQRLSEFTLAEIFQELDINEFTKAFSDIPVLKNLILNGYINEDYSDYISLFHEESISKSENSFIQSVKSARKEPFKYKLENTENVILKLEKKYFGRIQILNFHILDFLLKNKDRYSEKLKAMIELLKSTRKDSSEFLAEYLKRRENVNLLIIEISSNWTGLWDFVFSSEKLTEDEKVKVYSKIIETLPNNEIAEYQDENHNVRNYFYQVSDYETLVKLFNIDNDSNNINTLIGLFSLINVKLNTIPKPIDEYLDVYLGIYSNGFYELNRRNIKTILNESNENENEIDLEKGLYSSIYYSSCESLKSVVNDNINDFVDPILLVTTSSVNESEESLTELLINNDLEIDFKIKIIEWIENKLLSIDQIPDENVTSELLMKDKVTATWHTVMTHYKRQKEQKFDKALNHFLNIENNYNKLGEVRIDTGLKEFDFGNSDYKSLSLAIIYEEDLALNSYLSLVTAIPFYFDDINFEAINTDKSKALINANLINLTNHNLSSLEEYNRPLKRLLFIKKQTQIIKLIDSLEITDNDYREIIISKEIELNVRFEIIKLIDENIILAKKTVLSETCDVLSLSEKDSFSNEFLTNVITSSNDWERQIKVIIKYFDQFENDEIETVVKSLGEEYKEVFKLRKRPKFNKNDLNIDLFEKLKSKGLIKSIQDVHKTNKVRVNANHK